MGETKQARAAEAETEIVSKKAKTDSDATRARFLSVFDELSAQMIAEIDSLEGLGAGIRAELVEYYRRCLAHTVPGGKLTRGLTVPKAVEVLRQRTLSDGEWREAAVLGWCVEWLQAMFLVADDVMDKSVTRRGAPCWYKLDHVTQANAINDALLLETLIYNILRKQFGASPHYLALIELLRDTAFRTEIGQHLDTNATRFDTGLDLARFTLDRYRAIVRYKTAYYSFYLSVALAMTICGETDPARFEAAKEVCMVLGEYFQVQDDYLDCYGAPEVIGKIGTDIRDAKCSWLVCQALQRASPEQRTTLEANYGKWDDECEAKVKAVFRELGLEAVYHAYEEDTKREVDALIAKVEPAHFRPVFEFLLGKIYKRDK